MSDRTMVFAVIVMLVRLYARNPLPAAFDRNTRQEVRHTEAPAFVGLGFYSLVLTFVGYCDGNVWYGGSGLVQNRPYNRSI